MIYPMSYKTEKQEHMIELSSFENVKSQGKTYDEAMIDLLDKFYFKLNEIIRNDTPIPKYYNTRESLYQEHGKTSAFLVPAPLKLKIKLYNLLQRNEIDLDEFNKGVKVDVYSVLNVKDQTTFWEFDEVFRKLGYTLDCDIMPLDAILKH